MWYNTQASFPPLPGVQGEGLREERIPTVPRRGALQGSVQGGVGRAGEEAPRREQAGPERDMRSGPTAHLLAPRGGRGLNRASEGHATKLIARVSWGQQGQVRSGELPSYILHNFWT